MTKKVTIIIPVYNGSNYLSEAIDCSLAQTYKNIEVLVVNDGSTDEGKTEAVAKSYGDKIRYIHQENGGVAAALNTGIKNATGDYVSWLSHDDLYIPEKIEIEMNTLEKLKDKNTIIFSNFELINGKGKFLAKTDFLNNESVEEFCQGFYPVIKAGINGCTTLINKKCFDEVGLFDTKLRTSQDYDMWLRLLQKYPSYCIEDSLVKYRIHEKQDTNKNPVVEKESNEIWKKIISTLSKEIIKSWNKNPYEIYYDLYVQMTASKYEEAAKLAYNKAKECYKDQDPYLSIIVPCYNAETTLTETVESLKKQTYGNFEIILVDDSSTDNTVKVIKELIKTDYRIIFTKNKNQKGVSGALNTGISMAKGKLIARQDSDDTAHEDRFKEQVQAFKKNPEIGFCATNINTIREDSSIIKRNLYKAPIGPIEFEAAFVNPVPNATIIYKKELIDKYKLEFSSLKTGEDYAFLLNYLYKTKTKGIYIDRSLYNYRILENSLFHSNVEESINNALEKAREYYYNIMGIEDNGEYNTMCFIREHNSKNFHKNIEKYYAFAKQCQNQFSWNNDDEYKLIKFLLNYQKIYGMFTNKKNTIYRRIKHQVDKNGIFGTIKWMICWPVKKVKRIIKK